jgi:RNA polymerase sigma-70 factor (ECF subfamily)
MRFMGLSYFSGIVDFGPFVRQDDERERLPTRTPFSRFFLPILFRPGPCRLPRRMDTLTTQALIEQVQHGDRAALESLCRRYQARVLATVRIRLGAQLRRKIESWDIVQQVMLEALGKVPAFAGQSEGAFMKYLNKVVENRIRDEADRQKAQRRDAAREIPLDGRSPGSSAPLDIPGGSSSPTPSALLMRKEELERLERAMDRLGEELEEYRDLVLAVKLEGQSYAELAAERGGSADAIRMKVQRAMAALARIYKELDSDDMQDSRV